MSVFFPYNLKTLQRLFKESKFTAPIKKSEEVGDKTVVASAQYKLTAEKSLKAYFDKVEDFYYKAAQQNAKLIVFPELFGITPLSASPLLKRLFKEPKALPKIGSNKQSGEEISARGLAVKPTESGAFYTIVKALIKSLSKMNEFFDALLSGMSKKYAIVTASGSSIKLIDGKLYNVQSLINSDGKLLGTQKKINPMESELNVGINYAEEINTFDLSFGKIAIPVCMDASYFENFKIFYEKGVNIVAMGTFNTENYHEYLALRGVRLRVSEYPLFAIKAAMTGYVMKNVITGYAEIDATVDYVAGGVINKCGDVYGNEVVFAEIPVKEQFSLSPYRKDFDQPILNDLLREIYL